MSRPHTVTADNYRPTPNEIRDAIPPRLLAILDCSSERGEVLLHALVPAAIWAECRLAIELHGIDFAAAPCFGTPLVSVLLPPLRELPPAALNHLGEVLTKAVPAIHALTLAGVLDPAGEVEISEGWARRLEAPRTRRSEAS